MYTALAAHDSPQPRDKHHSHRRATHSRAIRQRTDDHRLIALVVFVVLVATSFDVLHLIGVIGPSAH